jgi:hypothetical protein
VAFTRYAARIADCWVHSDDVDDWCAAYQTAAAVAAREPSVCEVSAWASTRIGKEALERAAFRVRDSTPISLLGETAPFEGHELHLQMVDSDASFLSAECASFLT